MFDMIASKIGEAQAFADGVASLDFVNMDRLLEEQEREERSKDESLRLLRTSGDTTDVASSQDSSGTSALGTAGRVAEGGNNSHSSGGALGEIEIPQLPAAAAEPEQLRQQHRSRQSSPIGNASESSSFRDRFASIEDGGANFEDEFDPILASIRKPPQQQELQQPQQQQQSERTTATAAPGAGSGGGERKQEPFLPSPENDTVGRPTAGSTFAAGFLSMLPGDMRAKAGEVMAQSSTRISESANAIRSALGPGGAAPSAADKFKRRQSDPTYRGDISELEEGKGGTGGSRRMVGGGEGDEDEVRLMNVNDLLSEEEKQQLSSLSGVSAGAGRFYGWRRLRKYVPVAVVIGLLGLFYLWRWTRLVVADSENGVASLGPGRM